MFLPDTTLVRQLENARANGISAHLNEGEGLAHIGILEAVGPDAVHFLQSQTTNDVAALDIGDGQLSARVTRTGHLRFVFSLHRLPDHDGSPRFWLLIEHDAVSDLYAALDQFLFADDVTLIDRSDTVDWLTVQGDNASECCEGLFGPIQFEPWSTLPEYAFRALSRRRGSSLEHPVYAIRRTLTGDTGFLIGVPTDPSSHPLIRDLDQAFENANFALLDEPIRIPILETLRIEAGIIRAGHDAPQKKRLLPETGIEGQVVSYTKGCYLGQEVIARVRTYGSVPFALRALRLKGGLDAVHHIPESGSFLYDLDEKKIGQWVHTIYSPVTDGPVAIVYLNRASRTPGQTLTVRGRENQVVEGSVQLLPLYSAPDQGARAFFLYDRAVRKFANGATRQATVDLEQALRLDPSLEEAYEALGVILARSGRFHEAIDFFRRLEELAPTEPLVNTNLSLYYMKIGDKPTAEDEAAKAVQKQFRNHLKAKGKTVSEIVEHEQKAKQQDANRKKNMFGKVLAFDADDPIALFGLGSAHCTLQEWEPAVEILARALVADKNNSAIYLAHGKALEALARIPEAMETYKQGMVVASKRGDLMPLREMEHRMLLLEGGGDT